MRLLSIETSCDDTGVAILEAENYKLKALANIVSSQPIHQNYGGVFPMMAKREHQNNLVPVTMQALRQAKLLIPKSKILNSKQIPNSKLKILNSVLEKEQDLLPKLVEFLQTHEKPEVDYIAVTRGPGLEPCLWVGVNFARALSYIWGIPLIPVNHIEAHIAVNFLGKINGNSKSEIRNPKHHLKDLFPAISLVVSGGHTQLMLAKGMGKYQIIGETRDDAAGECFDKCAKLLGLGYPGGPIISKIAADYKLKARSYKLALPRPMINSNDYDFSFSGLKTAVLYATRGKELTEEYVGAMCVEIQQAIIDVLLKKTINAAKAYKAKTIILGGGVSANSELRSQFEFKTQNAKLKILFPEKNLSTDNALMIAVAAALGKPFDKLRASKKASWKTMEAYANLRIGL